MKRAYQVLTLGVAIAATICTGGGCATQPSPDSEINGKLEYALDHPNPNVWKFPPSTSNNQLVFNNIPRTPSNPFGLANSSSVFESVTGSTSAVGGYIVPTSTPPGPPTGTIPSYAPVDPTSTMDLACRPKLTTTPLKSLAVAYEASTNGKKPGQLRVKAGPLKAFWLTAQGTILMRDGDPIVLPVGVFATIPKIDKTNIQDISGPFVDTEPAVGPVATITYGADGKLLLGPVGMIRPTDIEKMRAKGIYPVVGPAGTVTVISPMSSTGVVTPPPVPMVVTPNGQLRALALPGQKGDPMSQPIASTVIGQSVLDGSGQPVYLNAPVTSYMDGNCHALSPLTRLILENAGVSANYNYSDQSGVISAPGSNPTSIIQTTATSTYGVGIGYTNKPILKQLRALLYPSNARDATYKQGTFWEDAIFNGVTVNASYSYGRTLALKSSSTQPTPIPTNTFNTRPYYSVGATWSMDLERLWVYGTTLGTGARPLDSGFYYQPPEGEASTYFISPHQEPSGLVNPLDKDDNRP